MAEYSLAAVINMERNLSLAARSQVAECSDYSKVSLL